MAQSSQLLPVFIVLTEQPQKQIMERFEAAGRLSLEIAEQRHRQLMSQPFAPESEVQRAGAEVEEIIARIRRAAFEEVDRAIAPSQAELETLLVQAGARRIYKYGAINMITAEIPAPALAALESHPLVAKVFPVSRHYSELAISVPELGTSAFWNSGWTGGGQSVAVLDTGVRTNHPAFHGKAINSRVFLSFGATNPCFGDNAASAEDQHGHGTHVAGIVMSQGSTDCIACQGVAKGLSTLYNLKIGYKLQFWCPSGEAWADNRDVYAALDWLLRNTGVRIINYSFGAQASSDDDASAQMMDQFADVYGALIVTGAGNDGPGDCTLWSPGIGYNIMSVGNWSTRGTMNSTSSRGPTLTGGWCLAGSGRYKPDIAAPGTGIYSTAHNWDDWFTNDFVSKTGTSMAAPHIAGAAALVRQAGLTDPLAIKALLLNSTDNIGWRKDRGWGYANLQTAWNWLYLTDTDSVAGSGQPGHFKLYQVANPAALWVTTTWNRHVVGSTSYLNDIDLHLYSLTSNTLLADSLTTLQNVEQINATPAEDVVLKVHMFTPSLGGGVSAEKYGIAFSHAFIKRAGPSLSPICMPPSPVAPSSSFSVSCRVTNTGDLRAFDVTGQMALPPGFSGTTQYDFGHTQAGSSSNWVSNTFTAPPNSGTYSFTLRVTSDSYGETFSGNTSFSVTVVGETVSTPSPPSGPTSGTTGVSYFYSTGGASSSLGHSIQYWFDWGDGTNSGWLAVGVTSASHSWSSAGTYTVRAKARCATHTAVESGWSGGVTVSITVVNIAPSAVSVTPSAGTGSAQTFSYVFSDPNGYLDLPGAQMLIHSVLSGAGGCWIYYARASNRFWLRDDGNSSWLGPVTGGTGATLSNSQCTLNAAGSSGSGSGNTLTVNVALSFSSSFGGLKNNYLFAQDQGGLSTGWQLRGTWTVPGGVNQAPSAVSVTPSAGTGSAQTFSYVFSDPNGYLDLPAAQVLIHSVLSGAGGCWIYYARASNQFWLRDDGNSSWLGPVTGGTGATLSNSQCTLNAAGSSGSGSGNTLTVNVALSFSSSFGGLKNNYLFAQDQGGLSTGWQLRGTWTVP